MNASVAAPLVPITVAKGDGIGPEITESVLEILHVAKAPIQYDFIEVGQKLYEQGYTAGIAPETWDVIRRNAAFLKAPITTQLGKGGKSLNVTVRTMLNLFANVRPSISYAPYVATQHPGINLVIIRENEEDLYAGIEHQQTREVTQVLKIISRPGTERIVRYAFEYARAYGRRKVTCMTKNNIMKVTDGLFSRIFEEVAVQYPDIKAEHMIIDIGTAKLAAQPEQFDVIVTLNLYGDILSDVAAQIAGSVGLAGSANIGRGVAMFEAVHGSAPDIAGKGVANPSGLLVAATQMLVHVGLAPSAELITNAWLTTLEEGIHTADIYRSGLSAHLVGTGGFTSAVIERLGERPQVLKAVQYKTNRIQVQTSPTPPSTKRLVGVDVFLDWDKAGRDPNELGAMLERDLPPAWRLSMITNRSVKVYPNGLPETFCSDHWRSRILPVGAEEMDYAAVLDLLRDLHTAGFEIIKTENLYTFDGERGYSLGQGE